MDSYIAKPIKTKELFEAIAVCTGVETANGVHK
jgi:hypothetical protein